MQLRGACTHVRGSLSGSKVAKQQGKGTQREATQVLKRPHVPLDQPSNQPLCILLVTTTLSEFCTIFLKTALCLPLLAFEVNCRKSEAKKESSDSEFPKLFVSIQISRAVGQHLPLHPYLLTTFSDLLFSILPPSSLVLLPPHTRNTDTREAPSWPITMETVNEHGPQDLSKLTREDQTLLLFARLMEGGQEDSETVRDIDQLTRLLTEDLEASKKEKSICDVIDADCLDTILCYLDMRQPENVRGHATLTISAYLKAAGEDGSQKLRDFFQERIKRGTYDDYIVAFCVAAAIFPIVPELTTELFLYEGFLPSLGPLMRRKWKSRKVETACLEMLNAACMNSQGREAVQKYCVEWLEEVVDQDPEEAVKSMYAHNTDGSHVEEGSVSMRRHSEQVQHLAAVILAKLRVRTAESMRHPSVFYDEPADLDV